MGSQFSIPGLLNLCSELVGYKILRPYSKTPTLQLPLRWSTYLSFNSDIVNSSVGEGFWGGTESLI